MIFAAFCWITLLAAVVTTLMSLSTDAKERRGHTVAAQLSKAKR
jgi:bacteriorhodopsin